MRSKVIFIPAGLTTYQIGMVFLISSMFINVGLLPMGAISSNCFGVRGPVNFWVIGYRQRAGTDRE